MSTDAPPAKKGFKWRRPRQSPPTVHIRPDGSRDVELPLREHLLEFRNRLIKAAASIFLMTALSFTFAKEEVRILTELARDYEIIALKPTEVFIAHLNVAFMTGIALSMPLLVYQLFRFMAPGLTHNEKRAVLFALPGITLFFLIGVLFCYFVVLPSALDFLLSFGEPLITSTPTVSEYLSFVTQFLLAVGLAFETPIIVLLLSRLGVATPLRLRRFRKWAYILSFVIAAIITPTPDPVNQIIVAVPIILLYEIGILFSRIGIRKPTPA